VTALPWSLAGGAGTRRRLESFLQRYLPCFYRLEQHGLARVVLQGKLSSLQLKTSEPIAYQAGRPRKPVQHFVGAGAWDDEAVMAELRRHVAQELADADEVLVLDPSAFPKSSDSSCGVARQWCGRRGKVENCQVGVFLASVSAAGQALVDRRLYLPREWAADTGRRAGARPGGGGLPGELADWPGAAGRRRGPTADYHAWVAGDDEFGR
jgi:SRSO17 transposase